MARHATAAPLVSDVSEQPPTSESSVSDAYETPTTGRQFAAQRLALGLSATSVANAMGVWVTSLLRWEVSTDASHLTAPICARWQAALAACAINKQKEIARAGLAVGDLPHLTLAQLLTLYATLAPLPTHPTT